MAVSGGFTQAVHQKILDNAADVADYLPADTDYIGYSENGTSETTHVARTELNADGTSGAWDAATAANPSVIQNTQALTSAACDANSITETHWAVFSASVSGIQKSRWADLDTAAILQLGTKMSHGAGVLKLQLKYTD